MDRARARRSCPNCRVRCASASCASTALPEYDAQTLTAIERRPAFFEASREDCRRREARSELGHGEVSAALNNDCELAIADARYRPQQLAGSDRPRSRRHDQQQDCEGCVRGTVGRRRRERRRDHRSARAKADLRPGASRRSSTKCSPPIRRSVEEFRAGKDKAFNALVGQAMKATQGKANPQQVNEILRRRLAG